MAIYMKFGDLKGNVTAADFKDQIELTSFQFGVHRTITMVAGSTANREQTTTVIQPIQISKPLDSSAALIFGEASSGSKGVKADISFTRTSGGSIETFVTYELTNCLISSYNVSSGADGVLTENLSLSYTEILVSYVGSDSDNNSGNPVRVAYDVTQGKKK